MINMTKPGLISLNKLVQMIESTRERRGPDGKAPPGHTGAPPVPIITTPPTFQGDTLDLHPRLGLWGGWFTLSLTGGPVSTQLFQGQEHSLLL